MEAVLDLVGSSADVVFLLHRFGTLILVLTILQAMLGLAQVIIALYPSSSE